MLSRHGVKQWENTKCLKKFKTQMYTSYFSFYTLAHTGASGCRILILGGISIHVIRTPPTMPRVVL